MRRSLSLILLFISILAGQHTFAQTATFSHPQYGAHDTIMSDVVLYENEWIPYKELGNVYISNLPPAVLAKVLQKYNRLRNAVYVTYPYARAAGLTLRRLVL